MSDLGKWYKLLGREFDPLAVRQEPPSCDAEPRAINEYIRPHMAAKHVGAQ